MAIYKQLPYLHNVITCNLMLYQEPIISQMAMLYKVPMLYQVHHTNGRYSSIHSNVVLSVFT